MCELRDLLFGFSKCYQICFEFALASLQSYLPKVVSAGNADYATEFLITSAVKISKFAHYFSHYGNPTTPGWEHVQPERLFRVSHSSKLNENLTNHSTTPTFCFPFEGFFCFQHHSLSFILSNTRHIMDVVFFALTSKHVIKYRPVGCTPGPLLDITPKSKGFAPSNPCAGIHELWHIA